MTPSNREEYSVKGAKDIKKTIFPVSSIVIVLIGALTGCSTNDKLTHKEAHETPTQIMVPAGNPATGAGTPADYLIHPGDELSVKFFWPELNETLWYDLMAGFLCSWSMIQVSGRHRHNSTRPY
jgi:hypothetical protein